MDALSVIVYNVGQEIVLNIVKDILIGMIIGYAGTYALIGVAKKSFALLRK